MPISTTCSSCGVRLKVNDSLLGRKAKCPKCGEVLVVKPQNQLFLSSQARHPGG